VGVVVLAAAEPEPLEASEFDYYVTEFTRTGFTGG
jgi:hypothetical protein